MWARVARSPRSPGALPPALPGLGSGTSPAHPADLHGPALCTLLILADTFSCRTEHTLPVSFYFCEGLLASRAFCSWNFLLKYFT